MDQHTNTTGPLNMPLIDFKTPCTTRSTAVRSRIPVAIPPAAAPNPNIFAFVPSHMKLFPGSRIPLLDRSKIATKTNNEPQNLINKSKKNPKSKSRTRISLKYNNNNTIVKLKASKTRKSLSRSTRILGSLTDDPNVLGTLKKCTQTSVKPSVYETVVKSRIIINTAAHSGSSKSPISETPRNNCISRLSRSVIGFPEGSLFEEIEFAERTDNES